MTTFTNSIIGVPEPPEGEKKPRTPGRVWAELADLDEYETALGLSVPINHAGDCFD